MSEAAIKLTLDNAQFMVTIKRTGDEVDKVGKRGKKGMDLFGAGAGAAKKSMMDLGGAVKNTLRMALSLGGAFSVGSAVVGATKLKSSYAALAFKIQTATGAMTKGADVQKIVERAAASTGRSNNEMVESFDALQQATGDVDFASKSLEAVGITATATKQSLADITTVADQLHTKFDVTAEGMKDALAQVYEASTKGGPAFSEFADVIGNVGAEMLAAGLTGKKGLDFMLGTLVSGDDKAGGLAKQVKGLKLLLRGLGDADELKKLSTKLALDPKKFINEKDAIARLRTVFSKGKKGVEALLAPMAEGEEKETLKVLFVKPFEKAMKDAETAGLKGKAAIDAALVTFDAQIGAFGKAQLDGAALQERANEARKEPEAQLNEALNRLNVAFSQPEIIHAIDELSKHLPALAKVVGDTVAWLAKNPILGTAIGLGAKAGSAGLVGMAGAALKGAGAAGGAASAAGGGAAAAVGGAAVGAGAAAAGGFMGGGVIASAAAAGPIVAALAVGGLLIGEQIGKAFDAEKDVMGELASATAAGFGGGTLEQMQAALARLEAAKSTAREANVGGGAMDWLGSKVTGIDTEQQGKDAIVLAQEATARLQRKIREREQAMAAHVPAAPDVMAPAAAAAKPRPIALEANTPKMIGVATATALGGTVLNVRIANLGELGLGRATTGPGGSRGPMVAGRTAPGGGV